MDQDVIYSGNFFQALKVFGSACFSCFLLILILSQNVNELFRRERLSFLQKTFSTQIASFQSGQQRYGEFNFCTTFRDIFLSTFFTTTLLSQVSRSLFLQSGCKCKRLFHSAQYFFKKKFIFFLSPPPAWEDSCN